MFSLSLKRNIIRYLTYLRLNYQTMYNIFNLFEQCFTVVVCLDNRLFNTYTSNLTYLSIVNWLMSNSPRGGKRNAQPLFAIGGVGLPLCILWFALLFVDKQLALTPLKNKKTHFPPAWNTKYKFFFPIFTHFASSGCRSLEYSHILEPTTSSSSALQSSTE